MAVVFKYCCSAELSSWLWVGATFPVTDCGKCTVAQSRQCRQNAMLPTFGSLLVCLMSWPAPGPVGATRGECLRWVLSSRPALFPDLDASGSSAGKQVYRSSQALAVCPLSR